MYIFAVAAVDITLFAQKKACPPKKDAEIIGITW